MAEVKRRIRSADLLGMWLDELLILLVAALAFAGFRWGALESGVRLLGLPVAYVAAAAAAWFGGPPLAQAFGIASWLGSAAAGVVVFIAAHTVVGICASKIRRNQEYVSQTSRLGGAVLGSLRAVVLMVPLLWLANLTEGARESGIRPDFPDLSGAMLRSAAEPVFEAGSEALMDTQDPSERLAASFVARPRVAIGAARSVLEDPRLRLLQSDPNFWADLERGAVVDAMRRPTFRQLASDASFRRKLGDVGVVSPDAVTSASAFQTEMALALSQIAPRIEAIRNDPELDALLKDPEIRAQLERGESMALLGHPRFRAIVARLAGDAS